MQPRSEGSQRCLTFQVTVTPRTRVHTYRDYLGNAVHHFDVPSAHRHLMIVAEATVDVAPPPSVPLGLGNDAWGQLDVQLAGGDFWEMLTPSQFSQWTDAMDMFATELSLPAAPEARLRDPFALLMQVNSAVYQAISYVPKSTRVDSPVDDALRNRQGVCQDYSHIMLALVRRMGIPCRYVSGYLFHKSGEQVRSTEGATHAWVEAYVPEIGWVGFDPANRICPTEAYIRTSIGLDYWSAAPVRGLRRGVAEESLAVTVTVQRAGAEQ